MGRRVREAIALKGERRGTGFAGGQGAGTIVFDRLGPQELRALRVRVGGVLSVRASKAR
jgi:hypothetical protein